MGEEKGGPHFMPWILTTPPRIKVTARERVKNRERKTPLRSATTTKSSACTRTKIADQYCRLFLSNNAISGKSSLCEDSQDSHPVSESTPTFSSAMGFDSTFTSSARIQDSHPVKESVKYSRQPWESSRFPSPMGIYLQFTVRMRINFKFTLSMWIQSKIKLAQWFCF